MFIVAEIILKLFQNNFISHVTMALATKYILQTNVHR